MDITISSIIMWILVVFLIMGIIVTYFNLTGKQLINKYEGLAITSISLILSCVAGVLTSFY